MIQYKPFTGNVSKIAHQLAKWRKEVPNAQELFHDVLGTNGATAGLLVTYEDLDLPVVEPVPEPVAEEPKEPELTTNEAAVEAAKAADSRAFVPEKEITLPEMAKLEHEIDEVLADAKIDTVPKKRGPGRPRKVAN